MADGAASSPSGSAEVVCCGSTNVDMTAYVPRMPAPGETIHGHTFKVSFGGKGANQAVMAAKLGFRTAMISKVGDDANGRESVANLAKHGVDTAHVTVTTRAPTGVAPILVDDSGENSIVVIPGANHELTEEDVHAADTVVSRARVMLTQLEVLPSTTQAALALARKHGVTTVFNPAPAKPDLPDALFALCDVIIPNETEACMLAGASAASGGGAGADASVPELTAAAKVLLAKGAGAVVVTLGAKGALVVQHALAAATDATDGEESKASASTGGHVMATVVPGVAVAKDKVVDTVGAGDAFVAALGCGLARGKTLVDAVAQACRVAALTVQVKGAQAELPNLAGASS